VQVCRAVQHAHHKGVMHRDIKPRNVLVATADGRPLAKVIDFGIAKATTGRLTERTLFTEHRAMVGTLEYMSPEQAEGLLDVDTRADVYSLGVLLYELLTGSTPFVAAKLLEAGFGEMLRTLREVEPERPSVRVSSKAGAGWAASGALGGRDPKQLFGSLRGDLDWVVMKALEKDRGRRYGTADGLAADVESYLRGEAVTAVPPSVGYRVRTFVRRNRALVIGSSGVVLTLVVGIVGIGWALGLAKEEQEKMRSAAATAVQVMERVVGAGDGAMSLHVTDWGSRPVGADEQDHARVVVVLESLAEHAETIRAELTARERSVTVLEYSARLRAALAHANERSPQLAGHELDLCPGELRGFEWRLVNVQREERVRRVFGEPVLDYDESPDGDRLYLLGRDRLIVLDGRDWSVVASHELETTNAVYVRAMAHHALVNGDSYELVDVKTGRSHLFQADGAGTLGTRYVVEMGDRLQIYAADPGYAPTELLTPGLRRGSTWDGSFVCYETSEGAKWTTHFVRTVAPFDRVDTDGGYYRINQLGPVSTNGRTWFDAATGTTGPTTWTGKLVDYVGPEHAIVEQPDRTCRLVAIRTGHVAPVVLPQLGTSDGYTLSPEPRHGHRFFHGSMGMRSLSLETGEWLPEPIADGTQITADGLWWTTSDEFGLDVAAARPPQVALPKSADPVLSLGTTHRRESLAIRSVTSSFDTVFVPDTGVPHHTACTRHIAVAAGSGNGRFQLRIDAQGHAVHTTADSPDLELAHAELLACRALALDHTGACAAAIVGDRVLHWAFDTSATARPTPAELCPMPAGPSGVPVLAVHGPTVLLGDAAGILRRYEVGSPDATHTERIGAAALTALRCSPDGSLVLVGCANGTAHLRRTADLGLVVALAGHFDAVTTAAWTPDGTRIATGSRDGTVRLWPTEAQPLGDQVTPFLTLTEPQIHGRPSVLLVTPDGERLVCGYDDGALRVWDTVPWAQRAATVTPLFPRATK
jgi:hypothetical protein